jgi:polar amino acid transport system substrate-binding protein
VSLHRYSVVLLLLVGSWSCAVRAAESLSFFTEQFPPYNMTVNDEAFAHKAADIDGLCTDIVKAVMARTSYDYRIKLRNWSYGIDRVKRTPNTGLFCAVQTPERQDQFQWVGPLTSMRWVLFSKPGSAITLGKLEDAHQYVIGGYKGDAMTNYLIQQGLNVSVIGDDRLNPQRLEQGSIDLWITDSLAGPYKAADNSHMDSLRPVLMLNRTPVFLAINRETSVTIVAALQKVLDDLKREGVIEQMEQQYGL